MRLVMNPPGVESGGHSYCCDFGKLLLITTTKALILPQFLFTKTIKEVE